MKPQFTKHPDLTGVGECVEAVVTTQIGGIVIVAPDARTLKEFCRKKHWGYDVERFKKVWVFKTTVHE